MYSWKLTIICINATITCLLKYFILGQKTTKVEAECHWYDSAASEWNAKKHTNKVTVENTKKKRNDTTRQVVED